MPSESQIAAHYDWIAHHFSETRKQPWAKEFELYQHLIEPGMQIADLGCGNGRLFGSALKNLDITYTGIDISEDLLRIAREQNPEANAQFIAGSLTDVPILSDSIDVALAVASFHHLGNVADRRKSLAEVMRILKPGGQFAVSVWNLWQKQYRKYIWQAVWRCLRTGGKYAWNDTYFFWRDGRRKPTLTEITDFPTDLRYYHAFTVRELRNLLLDAGFTDLEVHFPTRKTLNAGRWQAENLVFVCRKPFVEVEVKELGVVGAAG